MEDYALESNCECRDTASLPQHSYVAVTGYIFNLTMHSPPRSLRCVPHRTDENDLTAHPPKPMFRLTSWGGAERSPNVLRSLIEIRTPSFSGWGCDCCAWTHQASILTNPQLPDRKATTDFNLHLCGDGTRFGNGRSLRGLS